VLSRTRWIVFFVSTPLVLLVAVGGLLGATNIARPQQGFPHLLVFQDVVSLIINGYVEEVDIDAVMAGAMRGLADGLDSSSAYLTPDEVRTIDTGEPLPRGDVGLVITRQFYLRVVGVRDGSSADRAGLETGDFIRMIDGEPTRDMSALAGTRLLRGTPGSTVDVLIIRTNPADPHEFALTREVLDDVSISGRRLPGGEAYIRVSSFGPGTAAALGDEIDALAAAAEHGVVIDLRGTANGSAVEGIAAARHFVSEGTLAVLTERHGPETVTDAHAGDGAETMPVVLIVSNGTAHAAEIFAAALAGNDRAEIVGAPTAGLASLQRLVRLPDGHGLWMTYARYVTPDRDPIHGRGVVPDVVVLVPIVEFDDDPPATDEPLDKALEWLRTHTS
jgi:carboxyl-terminal processing protease